MADKWLGDPPDERGFQYEESSVPYSDQLNALRATSLMGARVTALHMRPSVMVHARGGNSLANLIALISSEYAERFQRGTTKTLVHVGTGIPYTVPDRPGILCCQQLKDSNQGDARVVFATKKTAEKLGLFGVATLFILVKKGRCVDNHNEGLLRSIARAVTTGRVEKILILSEDASSEDDLQRARQVFRGLAFVYDEISFE